MASEAKKEFRTNEGIFSLMLGLLLAPVAWGAQQQTLYTMVPWACQSGHFFVMHLVSIAAVAVALVGSLVAWRNWDRLGRGEPGEEGGAAGRSRFLAAAGVIASLFFALVICAQWIATFVLHPCMF
ncbi:MAG: hypothetical protein LC746_02645 [Acidobacteria bacterium]|nr:hypothetical protein [Acidobacteriota bacterium]